MPFLSLLDLREYTPNEWVVLSPLRYRTQSKIQIDVPRGFITDLASIPAALRNVFNVNGSSRKAAVLHDFLYSSHGFIRDWWADPGYKVAHKLLSRAECDAIFREALQACGVDAAERNLMWLGVRAGGWMYFNKRQAGIKTDFDFVPDSYWRNA